MLSRGVFMEHIWLDPKIKQRKKRIFVSVSDGPMEFAIFCKVRNSIVSNFTGSSRQRRFSQPAKGVDQCDASLELSETSNCWVFTARFTMTSKNSQQKTKKNKTDPLFVHFGKRLLLKRRYIDQFRNVMEKLYLVCFMWQYNIFTYHRRKATDICD